MGAFHSGCMVLPALDGLPVALLPGMVRSLFGVSAFQSQPVVQSKPARPRAPSLLDLAIEWEESPPVRGVSAESWHRARGWTSDDE